MIRIALSITTAADFDAKRRESFARLEADLRLGDVLYDSSEATVPIFGRIPYHVEGGRNPHHVWSRNQWEWASKQDVDWVLQLQDDVLVAPDFWARLEVVLRDVMSYEAHCWFSLLTNHIGSRLAFTEGASGYWTRDGLMGNGYGATPLAFGDLLHWRDTEIVPGSAEHISEDVLINLFALATDSRIYTPLPGLIDHDPSVGTLHAHEHRANRRAYVRWDDEDRRGRELLSTGSVEFGRFYETAHSMLPGVLLDTELALGVAGYVEHDTCPARYARWREMIVAQPNWPAEEEKP